MRPPERRSPSSGSGPRSDAGFRRSGSRCRQAPRTAVGRHSRSPSPTALGLRCSPRTLEHMTHADVPFRMGRLVDPGVRYGCPGPALLPRSCWSERYDALRCRRKGRDEAMRWLGPPRGSVGLLCTGVIGAHRANPPHGHARYSGGVEPTTERFEQARVGRIPRRRDSHNEWTHGGFNPTNEMPPLAGPASRPHRRSPAEHRSMSSRCPDSVRSIEPTEDFTERDTR